MSEEGWDFGTPIDQLSREQLIAVAKGLIDQIEGMKRARPPQAIDIGQSELVAFLRGELASEMSRAHDRFEAQYPEDAADHLLRADNFQRLLRGLELLSEPGSGGKE